MSDFAPFREAVAAAYDRFSKRNPNLIFYTNANSDKLWDLYLNSYPIEERQGYNCSTCEQFIRAVGGIVSINLETLTLESLWDGLNTGYELYDNAAKALSKYVATCKIQDPFIHEFKSVGNATTKDTVKNVTWSHFRLDLHRSNFNTRNFASNRAKIRDTASTYKRAIHEINIDAVNTILELIDDDNLYRGVEYRKALLCLKEGLNDYSNSGVVKNSVKESIYFWSKAVAQNTETLTIAGIRNSAIGTLLQDLSETNPEKKKTLEKAVASFENKVSGVNYKRPKALYTQNQLNQMRKALDEGGYLTALERRLANADDLSINDVLFVDRSANKLANSIFDTMSEDMIVNPKKLNAVEISVEDFLDKALPGSDSLEILFSSNLESNLVSLVTSVDPDSKPLFKWGNNLSWCYKNAITDTLIEKIKNAGGEVNGQYRFSLEWDNKDDMDLSLLEPDGNNIYYGVKRNVSSLGGVLDVDANGPGSYMDEPVENITYANDEELQKLYSGSEFILRLHQFDKRSNNRKGWRIQVVLNETEYNFSGDDNDEFSTKKEIARFVWRDGALVLKSTNYSPQEGIFSGTSKDIWGIGTNKFHKVVTLTKSPNYWGYNQGNEHLFFFVDGVKNDEKVRGIFNEFIHSDLERNYKNAFEALGGNLPVQSVEQELSGFGFSKTLRKDAIVRITTGKIKKIYKIKF